jgi:hypothetical protein
MTAELLAYIRTGFSDQFFALFRHLAPAQLSAAGGGTAFLISKPRFLPSTLLSTFSSFELSSVIESFAV